MAAATERIGFGATVSLSYELPYKFAKTMSLDHLTKGRVAWIIVTSYQQSAAINPGLDRQVPHDERYDIADEFTEVSYKLWESSWEDDAVVRDLARGVFTDPSKVHDIDRRASTSRYSGHISASRHPRGPRFCYRPAPPREAASSPRPTPRRYSSSGRTLGICARSWISTACWPPNRVAIRGA
jgi:long-chain alkane monooxygenase